MDSGLEVSGTRIETTSGVKELTVTATNDAGAVAIGSKGHGLDIPGVVFILKPFNGDQIITMVESGTCPASDVTANWIMTNKHVNIITSDVTGTFAYPHATTSAVLPTTYFLDHDTGALSGDTVSVIVDASVDSPSNGFVYGTIGGTDFVAMGNVNVNGSGKNFRFCIGINPGEPTQL